MSVARDSLKLTGLFEAEVLVELMLRYWHHPHAADPEFRNNLLETAVEVLTASVQGTQFVEAVPAQSMNLVAAIWYAENNSLDSHDESDDSKRDQRQAWVTAVRQSLPSCFCDPDLLN